MTYKRLLAVCAAVALTGLIAASEHAKSVTLSLFSGPNCQEASQQLSCMNQLIQAINSSALGAVPGFAVARNYLDNGAMQISQRGTAAQTCALNGAAITTAAYAADRWGCEVNVAVGAGQLTTITATPTPPPGFTSALKLVRNSGALTQPQCVYQEVPTYRATQLQGQTVTFSAYVQALAGLAADQGAATQTVNLLVITGTGSDQGFGTWTASPALTPAWTGVATAVNASQALPVTPVWTRYSANAQIPVTATEIAVAICFTPTATGAGATDGFAFTGAQLEQGGVASTYEFKPANMELSEAQRYLVTVTEPASGVSVPISSTATAATTAVGSYGFPVTMRAAPTFTALGTALSGSTWTNKCGAVNNALGTTFFVTATANTVAGASYTITSSGATAGFACVLTGAGGGSILSWSADF